ncbi:unnamed protein product [Hyaloperonospora brassicae]|uniref:Uncharacterized protein n=1 Tax=Hyaloperonospora brassicae TaxID=162125 RepID=A0AAV0UT33_HYABA|nr:unnamed protein product [Hyaloperonospora brassicae]
MGGPATGLCNAIFEAHGLSLDHVPSETTQSGGHCSSFLCSEWYHVHVLEWEKCEELSSASSLWLLDSVQARATEAAASWKRTIRPTCAGNASHSKDRCLFYAGAENARYVPLDRKLVAEEDGVSAAVADADTDLTLQLFDGNE